MSVQTHARLIKTILRGIPRFLWALTTTMALMIMIGQAHLAEARGFEADDGGTETGSDDRNQRMEMLRSATPTSPKPASSNTNSNYPSYSYPEVVRHQTASRQTRAPQAQALSQSKSRPVQPPATVKASLRPENKRSKPAQPPSLAVSKPTNSKVSKGIKSAATKEPKKRIRNDSRQTPRCGFCLVNGIVYCGDQGVSLENLIQQDHKQRTRKHLKSRAAPKHTRNHPQHG